jgi:hypothetical protein
MLLEDYKEKYLKIVEDIIGFFSKNELKKYVDIARDPINKISHLDTLQNIIIYLITLALVLGFLPSFIGQIISAIFQIIMTGGNLPVVLTTLGISMVALLIGILLNILFLMIYAILEYLIAKILNGAGSLKEHITISLGSYLVSYIISIPILIITAIIMMLEGIPFFRIVVCFLFLPMFILGLLGLIVGLYGLYIKLIMVKELHNFDNLKGLATMLIPLCIVLGITIGIIVIMVLFFSATLGGLMITQQQLLQNLMI